MITLQDIADKTGVTKVTVSYVLNGLEKEKHISQGTACRIKETALKLGYTIDDFARAMSTGRAKVIGFLAASPHFEFVASVMTSIMKHAAPKGYMVKVLYYDEMTTEENIIALAVKQRLSGLVIYSMGMNELRKISDRLFEKKIPVATLFNGKVPEGCIQVYSDDYEGGRAVAEYLVSLGHRKIAYIGNNPLMPYSVKRKKGFLDYLSEKEIQVTDSFFHTKTEREKIKEFIQRIMELKERPTAFFCTSDWLAIEALTILQGNGFRVPDDVSIVGYANLEAGKFCHPALTTVAENYSMIGEKLVLKIIDRLKLGSIPSEKTDNVGVTLIVRESSGPVPKL
ncbi:MAG: hypothetical protein A2020_11605 [Lentisphaerae bacterium GWF2_45_14]|nr:MAG: hypothetical protein A2020_11605 [Lentisphaerae bacterium GWF2_45_14]